MCHAPQLGHTASVGATALSWVRRLSVRVLDCLLLGCAMGCYRFLLCIFIIYVCDICVVCRWLFLFGLSSVSHVRMRCSCARCSRPSFRRCLFCPSGILWGTVCHGFPASSFPPSAPNYYIIWKMRCGVFAAVKSRRRCRNPPRWRSG